MKVALITLLIVLSSVIAAEKHEATQPIEAQEGGKAPLQYRTNPPTNLENDTLTCKRLDGNFSDLNSYIYSRRLGQEHPQPPMEQYRNRTRLVLEDLRKGIVTLEIFPVHSSDSGRYKCFIRKQNITFNFTIVVTSKKKTASAGIKTNPDAEPTKHPNVWGIVIPIVLGLGLVLVVIFRWNVIKPWLSNIVRRRRDKEESSEKETLKTQEAERDEQALQWSSQKRGAGGRQRIPSVGTGGGSDDR
ncbi:selection and upkeep of intraepithelial T-cells protein 6-like isoform X7 [Stegastes partitus]|uniref:Selection and upkeep of intraepithelial T-cells protein 6-like isoform X7 n=1 Tax=Stegastes partitus TaxID=144197 RepID=A0A9Y4K4N0_9TELE|nr:PREDICTED: selection and upkeep of intraepithelial T-cells protein 6-like isoform X7 [Stegastes partitus]